MREPRRKYTGCLATKLTPDDYTYCLQEYNNPQEKYEKYKLVPNNALRETRYWKAISEGNEQEAKLLKLPEKAKISYLPMGLFAYYEQHPERYQAYIEELATQKKFLEAVCSSVAKGVTTRDRERLRQRIYASIGEEEEEEI